MGPYTFSYIIFAIFWVLSIYIEVIVAKMFAIDRAPISSLSAFDCRIKDPFSKLGLYLQTLGNLGKINVIIFLVVLGMKMAWWLPIALYASKYLVNPALLKLYFWDSRPDMVDVKIGTIMITGTVVVPVLSIGLWIALYSYL